jgi:hypothetical protein
MSLQRQAFICYRFNFSLHVHANNLKHNALLASCSKKSNKHSHKHDKKAEKKAVASSSSSESDIDEGSCQIGPTLPPAHARSHVKDSGEDPGGIGPQLPPNMGLPSSSKLEDDDDEIEIGPCLPQKEESQTSPADGADRSHGPAPSTSEASAKKSVGPALPAGIDLARLAHETAKVDWQKVAQEEEEDEFDTVGPAMPGRETIGYLRATEAAQARILNNILTREEQEAEAAKPKHEDWMTMLPEHRDLSLTLEQQQKNRTFQRKEKESGGDSSGWTETPADRERKEREKQLGISGAKRKHEEPSGPDPSATAKRLIDQYNQALRPKSLVEIHQEKLRKEAKALPGSKELTPGSWDRSQITQNHKMDSKTAAKM